MANEQLANNKKHIGMKPKLFIITLLALIVAGCTLEPIPEPEKEGGKIVTITATISPETRVAYEDSNTPGIGGTLEWQTDDQLLLAGYDAGGTYLDCATFNYNGGNSFTGTAVPGADTYKAYYPAGAIVLDNNGNVQLADNFWQQTQSGNNTTAHLRNKLLLFDEVANPINQTFNLELKNDIIRFNLSNIPSGVGTLQKLIWTVETVAGGNTQWATLNIADVVSGTTSLTAYLAFDPTVTKIGAGGKVKITLIGDNSSYEWWSNPIANEKTYDPGKRYYASVSGTWTPAQAKFSYLIEYIWDGYTHQIWQTDASSTSPANLTIDWGDGTSTPIPQGASLSNPIASHTYTNDGDYTVTIYSDQVDPSLKQMPQITFNYNITNENVLSAVLTPFPNMAAEDFSLCFYNSMYLTSFPEDLFRYNTQAKNFTRCFEYCGFADVPANLFKYNTQATDFTSCFRDCFMGFTSIPADLFKYNTQAKNFTGCFYNCNQLNSIPKDLFRYNTQAKNFTSCFECCSISSIPAELFRHNTEATNFSHCFSYCSKLTSIPAELFRYNTLATNFTYCFNSCKLLSSIPTELFKYNTLATHFNQCFMQCIELTSIPEGLFDKNTLALYFSNVFTSCQQITSIPEGLFDKNTLAISFGGSFMHCTQLDSIPKDLFKKNTQAQYFAACFANCHKLTSIPAGLFDNNTQVTSFHQCFYRCMNLTTIPVGLFHNHLEATNFNRCFYDCRKLVLEPGIFPDPGTNANFFVGRTMDFGYCFYNVGLQATSPGTAPELWSFTGGGGATGPTNWTITDCFKGANVTNYNDIPNHWKGI
jgi:hypothetical protein